MDTPTPLRKRSRIIDPALYGLALLMVMLSPALGVLAAAVATWQALLAGSVWYMPLGLILVLAIIAIVQSHRPLDFALLGLLLLGMAGWFIADAGQQARMLTFAHELSVKLSLIPGLLAIATLAVLLLFVTLRIRKSNPPSCLA